MPEQRGTCSVCGSSRAITKHGAVRLHLVPKKLMLSENGRSSCEGSERPPVNDQYTWTMRQVVEQVNEISTEEYDKLLTQLVERVNGFVYDGDRLRAVIDTIAALRTDPVMARRLLQLA